MKGRGKEERGRGNCGCEGSENWEERECVDI